ncbi:hypothetical protein ACLOJK_027186 [Asimina triloba]
MSAVIAAAGAIKHEEIVEQVKKLFTKLSTDSTTATELVAKEPSFYTAIKRKSFKALPNVTVAFRSRPFSLCRQQPSALSSHVFSFFLSHIFLPPRSPSSCRRRLRRCRRSSSEIFLIMVLLFLLIPLSTFLKIAISFKTLIVIVQPVAEATEADFVTFSHNLGHWSLCYLDFIVSIQTVVSGKLEQMLSALFLCVFLKLTEIVVNGSLQLTFGDMDPRLAAEACNLSLLQARNSLCWAGFYQ